MKRFTKDTLISFVIPTGGQRGQSLKSLIDVIARFDEFKVEIIPVGNTSGLSDSQICKPVEVPELARDGEICKMRNLGGSASKGEILVFLDDDAEMPLQWQTLIKHLFEKILSEQIDIGSCRITGPNGRRWYDWNWASRKDIDCPSMLLPYSQTDENLYISGCCMIMRRNVWEQIRFDENRLNHQHDDVSFCHKAHEHGYKFGNETRAIIKHLLLPSGRNPDDPASGAGNFPEMIYLYRSGKLGAAQKLLVKLEAEISEDIYHYYSGLFRFIKKDYFAADEHFELCLSKDLSRSLKAQCLYRKSLCQLALKNDLKAQQLLSELLSAMPEHPFARYRSRRLKRRLR